MLKRLRTGFGRFKSSMRLWGLTESAACECGAPEQTVDHISNACPLYKPPTGETGLYILYDATRKWLLSTQLEIYRVAYARRVRNEDALRPIISIMGCGENIRQKFKGDMLYNNPATNVCSCIHVICSNNIQHNGFRLSYVFSEY